MPSIKTENDSDGDDDMSGGESQHSGSSPNREHDSSAEEADEPDSDDSSEMDENDCERRRIDCIDNLDNLEKQFIILREQLYRERINQVDYQLLEIRQGRSQEYLAPLERLSIEFENRKEVANVMRNFRLENIRHKYYSEQQAAKQHFESEKILANDSLREELLDKIRRLEEDRHNVDMSWDEWGKDTRTNRVRGPGRKKAVTVSGPYVVYMLADDDILDDWKMIRKALKHSTSVAS